jgi:parallel beta-helix repeat protein
MKRKEICKAIIAIAVTLAFVLPGSAAFANVGTIKVTSNSGNTASIKNIVETTNSNTSGGVSTTRDVIYVDDDIIKETHLGYEVGSSWYDGDPLSRIQDRAYNIHEIDRPDGKSYNFGFGKYVDSGTFIESSGKNLQSGVTADRKVKTNNFDSRGTGSRGTIYVDDNAPPEWYDATHVKTIQEGVNNASAGDTVYVFNGMYYENVEVGKSINLVGENKDNVIVDGRLGQQVVHITINEVNITGFTVRNGDHGIHLEYSSNSNIDNCVAYDNRYGFTPRNSPNTDITNCDAYNIESVGIRPITSPNSNFINCNLYNAQSGIFITDSSNCNIQNCNAYDIVMIDLSNGGNGFYLENSPMSAIENCEAYECTDYGLYLSYSYECVVTDCFFHDNTWNPEARFPSGYHSVGIHIEGSPDCEIMYCEIYDNDNGIYIGEGSPNLIMRDNAFYGNTEGGFDVEAWLPEDFYLDIDPSNTINEKPIYYLVEQSDLELNETHYCGYVGLISCSNILVRNIDMDGGGIMMVDTSNSTMTNVTSHDCRKGLSVYYSPNCDIISCEAYNCRYGIYGSSRNLIDCDFHDNDYGIYMEMEWEDELVSRMGAVNGGNVTNCSSYDNNCGIFEQKGSTISNCEVYNNTEYGIELSFESEYAESGSTLRENSFHDNGYNFAVDGWMPTDYHHDVDTSNTVNGRPIYYLVEEVDQIIDGATTDVGLVILASCEEMIVRNVHTSYNKYGLLLVDGSALITNCSFSNNKDGIKFYLNVHYNQITNCNVFDNERGIAFQEDASYNEIINCNLYNNSQFGYWSQCTESNSLIGCDIYGNGFGYPGVEPGQPYPISFQSGGPGVMIHYLTTDNHVENCTIHDNYEGIFVMEAGGNQIFRNNEIYNNVDCGLLIWKEGTNCVIENCTSYNNSGFGIYLGETCEGTCMLNCIMNDNRYSFGLATYTGVDIDPSNTINGKPMFYLVGASDLTFNETANVGWLGLISCTNITVRDTDVEGILLYDTIGSTISNVNSHNSRSGIHLYSSSNNNIVNCDTYTNAEYGIYLQSASGTDITGCTAYDGGVGGIYVYSSTTDIVDCEAYSNHRDNLSLYPEQTGYGILIENYNNNFLTNCNAYDNQYGIYLSHSQNNDITNCEVHDNDYGMYFYFKSQFNNIMNCDIYRNSAYGVYFNYYITGNQIHHNNFIDNAQHALDDSIDQYQWDDGVDEGNYWDDYTGIDSNGDGIGDTPYDIPGPCGGSRDRYPLMSILDDTPPIITDVKATPIIQGTSAPVNITCNVIDIQVDTVKVNISGPEGFTLEATMNEGNYYYYEDTYTILGTYYYYIWANDTSGNIAVSDTYSFVIIEFDKPISAVDPLPAWKKTVPFTVTATAYDNTGVANVTLRYRYSSNGTGWTNWTSYGIDEDAPWSWSFTGSDGYYQFYSIAVDTQGNVEDPPSSADASTGIDTTKPVTNHTLDGTMGGDGWYVSDVVVTLSAIDNLSGVGSTWYKVDAGYWHIYTTSFTVSIEGQHTVQYYSFDGAGNQEVAKSVSFKIDTIAPTTIHTLDGIIGSQGWYVTNVTVTLSANDVTSGVNYTKYKLNTGDWIVYTGFFVVTTDGNCILYYYSVDLAGNTEATKQVVFKIQHDVLPPVTTSEFDGIMGENNWFVSNVTVMLSAVDDSAGVAFTKYKLDAGAWTTYTGAFLVTEDAVHTLSYYSVDKVGNTESVKEAALKIDQTAPYINLTVNKTGLMKWLLTATVSDETSGIAKVEFYLDGEYLGEATEAPYEWECSQKGTAQAIVYDNAGNNAISDEVPFSQSLPQSQSSSSTLVSFGKDIIQGGHRLIFLESVF